MSDGMPTFHEYYQAYRENDEEKRLIAFAVIDLKVQSAVSRRKTRKARMAAIEAEHQRVEAKEAADRAWGVQQDIRIKELPSAMRNGTLSTRNRSW